MAKKKTKTKTTKKKTTTRKTSSSAASKKRSTKKASSKKTTTKKKAPAKKSKTTAKKSTSKSAPKKATTKKTTKKTTTKKAGGSKKKTTKKKTSAKGAGDSASKPAAPQYRVAFAGSRENGRAAAARLAQAAGLSAVRGAASGPREELRKYRKLSKSPFKGPQLDEFRRMLLEKRAQLVGDVTSMENEALGGDGGSLSHLPQHMADQGSDTFEQSLNLDLAASQRGLLKEIDDALERMEKNVYGICELLGKPIKIERLRNTPWARFSIEAARLLEVNPGLLNTHANDEA